MFDLSVPVGATKSASRQIRQRLEPHEVHCLVPIQLPVLDGVTIIAGQGTTASELLGSILYQLENHHVGLGLRTFGLGLRRPPHPSDKSVAIINSNGLSAADAGAIDRAIQVSTGVIWLVPGLNDASHWDRRIFIDSNGAHLNETPGNQACTFLPATLADTSS